MGLLLLAQRLRGNPSRRPVSLSTRESKVPKPHQICNLNDHGTASFQQKASETLTALLPVSKEILCSRLALSRRFSEEHGAGRRGYISEFWSSFPRVCRA